MFSGSVLVSGFAACSESLLVLCRSDLLGWVVRNGHLSVLSYAEMIYINKNRYYIYNIYIYMLCLYLSEKQQV